MTDSLNNTINDNLVLICGVTGSGKSASLRDIKNPEGVMYLGTEAGKKLPFNSKFNSYIIIDPMQVLEAFDVAETNPDIHTIIVDSLTFLLDQYESQYVLTSTNKMTAWGDFAQFFKKLMQEKVAASTKNVIFTAHTFTSLNEADMSMQTSVVVKGSLKNNGLEAYFSNVIATKKKTIKDLEPYSSDLLVITEEEEILGFKYCFQTKLTKATVNERIRSPIGMWTNQETFIDNNVALVMQRLHEYYK